MNNTSKILLWTGVAAFAGSLAWYLYKQYKLLMDYSWSIVKGSVKIAGFNSGNLNVKLKVSITNKSNIGAEIQGYNLDILINGVKISNIHSSMKQTLFPNSDSIISLDITVPTKNFNLKDLLNWGAWYLTNQNKILIQTKGYASISQGFLSVNRLPIDINMTLAELMA